MSNFIQNIRFKNSEIHKERIHHFVENLDIKEDCEYQCVIKPFESDRSLEQNNYFHGVVVVKCMELGYTFPEAKATLKAELLPIVNVRKLNGETTTELTHTANLGVKKMSKFIDECIILLARYGVDVPPPRYKGLDV